MFSWAIVIFLGTDGRFRAIPGKTRNGKELLPTLSKPTRKVSYHYLIMAAEVKEILLRIVTEVEVHIFKQLMARITITEGAGLGLGKKRSCADDLRHWSLLLSS